MVELQHSCGTQPRDECSNCFLCFVVMKEVSHVETTDCLRKNSMDSKARVRSRAIGQKRWLHNLETQLISMRHRFINTKLNGVNQ